MSEETQQTAPPDKPKLSKEQRSKIMQEAATRRWDNARKAKAKQARAQGKTSSKARPVQKPGNKITASKPQAGTPREFSTALRTAEKRLAKALEARAFHAAQYNFHAAQYHAVSREIPALQNLCEVLKNPLGSVQSYGQPLQQYGPPPPNLTIDQIVSDQPIPYAPVQRAAPPEFPPIPPPPAQHPANVQAQATRGGGGAISGPIEDDEDENRFLKDEPATAGGQWH